MRTDLARSHAHCVCRYAYFKKLVYFSTECIYSPNAHRGHARDYIKNLEALRPSSILGAGSCVCLCLSDTLQTSFAVARVFS